MSTYIVTFEVPDAARRNALKEHLKLYNIYCPIHDNCWAIVTDKSSVQIRDRLNGIITPSDRVFVIKSGVEAAWNGIYGTANADWLKEKL
ncbi:hypothetical protein AYI75_08815 [Shewanella algae]|nr:hypothetical protein AYI75_08815 [Shewanella algae]